MHQVGALKLFLQKLSLMELSSSFPLNHHLWAFFYHELIILTFLPDELRNGLNMLSILHRKYLFHQTVIELIRNLENYTNNDDYYVNAIELTKVNISSSANEFEQEEARFEAAKRIFFEAFFNTPSNTNLRRCRKASFRVFRFKIFASNSKQYHKSSI